MENDANISLTTDDINDVPVTDNCQYSSLKSNHQMIMYEDSSLGSISSSVVDMEHESQINDMIIIHKNDCSELSPSSNDTTAIHKTSLTSGTSAAINTQTNNCSSSILLQRLVMPVYVEENAISSAWPITSSTVNKKTTITAMNGPSCSNTHNNLHLNTNSNINRLDFLVDDDSQQSRSSTGSQRSGNQSCPKKKRQNCDEAVMSQIIPNSISHQNTCLLSGDMCAGGGNSNSNCCNVVHVSAVENTVNGYTFGPEKLFEYQWPPGSGEFFMLQEQISEYLDIKSFKRKYPDLKRRAVEVAERRYLKANGVVTETQCDLGLTPVKSEDIMELMSKDYPAKYADYIKVLDNRQQIMNINIQKGYQTPNVEKNKMAEFVKKAIKSASEYNSQLNQERKEERRVCMDLQTYTVHYPVGLGKDNKGLKHAKRHRLGKYPVALYPGQYQDWFMKYSPQELKYFPLNTVLYGPISDPSKLPPLLHASDGSQSDSDEDSNASDDSSCSSDRGTHDGEGDDSSDSDLSPPQLPRQPKHKPNAICKVCKGNSERNRDAKAEELVHCSDCDNSAHPTCLEFNDEMRDAVRSYAWQCMDCKTCVHCGKPHDEDKMMFCDKCDRGYHTFCVGLKSIPHGRWVCLICAHCAQCGTKNPAPVNQKAHANWQHEVIKILTPNGDTLTRHQVLCHACHKLRKQR